MAVANGVGTALSEVSAILKDLYLPPVTEQLNNEVLLLQRLETRSQDIAPGNVAVVPLHTGRSGGIGARAEGGALPSADKQRYAKATYDLKYLYGRLQVTGPSMVRTESDRSAFLQIMKGELDGIRADLKKDLARQVYGPGTGVIATTASNTSQTTLTLQSREPIDKGQLYVGMKIDIGTTADTDATATSRSITAVNASTPSITISGAAVTTSAGDVISRAGSTAGGASGASNSHEISGLKQIVASSATEFGGINPATAGNEYWDNLRDTNSGTARALSVDLMMQAYNKVRRAGGETSAIITSLGLLRAYFNLLQGQVRYVEPMNLKGGFSTLEFMNMPLIADIDAPWGEMYFLDEKFIKVYSPKDWGFLDEDGDVLKWVVGYDAWEAVLARYLNLGATRRNTQFLLDDLTDTSGV